MAVALLVCSASWALALEFFQVASCYTKFAPGISCDSDSNAEPI